MSVAVEKGVRLRHAWTLALTRRRCLALLAAVSVLFFGVGGYEAYWDAPTMDEPTYLAASLLSLKTNNISLNIEHPPLFKELDALPVLALNIPLPPITLSEGLYATEWDQNAINLHDLREAYFLARLVPLLVCIAAGFVIFLLGSALWNEAGGLFAALLWLLDPITLGLGHLDGIDVQFTFAVLLLAWATHGFWQRPERKRGVILMGIALGVCALGDIDGLALIAPSLLTVGWRLWRRPVRAVLTAFVMLLAGLVTLWIPYEALGRSTVRLPAIVPGQFIAGFKYLQTYDQTPATMFLMGKEWTGGRWWFYPLSFVAKLPPGSLVLLACGLVLCVSRFRRRPELVAVIGLPFLTFILIASRVVQDFGVRYATPMLGLGCVAAGSLAYGLSWLRGRPRQIGIAVIVLGVVTSFVMTGLSTPDSLSWVDPIVGRPYQTASDSSTDWAQDLYDVEHWLGPHPSTWTSIFTSLPSSQWFPNTRTLTTPTATQPTGWVAVSATQLLESPPLLWLHKYCPVRILDSTLLIYRFRHVPTDAPGPTTPVGPCLSSRYSHVL